MRRVLLVGLILLVVMTALPVLAGMDGMMTCSTCERSAAVSMLCPAVLVAAAALVMSLLYRRVIAADRAFSARLFAVLHERPPQLARG